jgi:hypothetical protein
VIYSSGKHCKGGWKSDLKDGHGIETDVLEPMKEDGKQGRWKVMVYTMPLRDSCGMGI